MEDGKLTKQDPTLPISKARELQFYALVKGYKKIPRWSLLERMNVTVQLFQREYKSYMEKYPNIHYNTKTREFSYEP